MLKTVSLEENVIGIFELIKSLYNETWENKLI
jgi:hypothetical protein